MCVHSPIRLCPVHHIDPRRNTLICMPGICLPRQSCVHCGSIRVFDLMRLSRLPRCTSDSTPLELQSPTCMCWPLLLHVHKAKLVRKQSVVGCYNLLSAMCGPKTCMHAQPTNQHFPINHPHKRYTEQTVSNLADTLLVSSVLLSCSGWVATRTRQSTGFSLHPWGTSGLHHEQATPGEKMHHACEI